MGAKKLIRVCMKVTQINTEVLIKNFEKEILGARAPDIWVNTHDKLRKLLHS